MKDQEQQGSYVLRGIKETEILIQQDEYGSNQKFGRNDQLHENEFEESIKLQEYRSWKQNEEPEIGLAVQRKTSKNRRYIWRLKKRVKWKLLQQRLNGKLMNEFRKLEQIHIDLKSPQKGSAEIQKIYDGGLVLEASKKNGRYCILKTEGCFVFSGHIDLRRDKQLLKTVEEMITHSHMQN